MNKQGGVFGQKRIYEDGVETLDVDTDFQSNVPIALTVSYTWPDRNSEPWRGA